jgi:type VI secretion system protein ImpA
LDSPALDLDALTAPVPGPNPAGDPDPPGEWQLNRLRDEIVKADQDRSELLENAGNRPRWEEIVGKATDLLTTQSKHLDAAVRLVEAVTRARGVAGVRDGLRLLHRLVADCWDRLHPLPEEGSDYDPREGRFRWLNEVASGARYPDTVTRQPLFTTKDRDRFFCYLDWVQKDRKDEFEAALPKADAGFVRGVYADLLEARQALRDLAKALDEKMGADKAPDFLSPEQPANIGTALEKCVGLVEEVARRAGVPLGEGSGQAAASTATAGGNNAPTSATGLTITIGNNRTELYRQLDQIAAALRTIEPHSPIPFMIERCVRLGELPFPQLMRAMIQETAALDALDRLLGVEPPPAT